MTSNTHRDITCNIIEKAKAIGASLAGIASISSLKNSPSYEICGKVQWPKHVKSVLILALSHEISEPELDWWDTKKGGTPGNRQLENLSKSLIQWLGEVFNINSLLLPYHVGKGGVFLKDVAVLSGLGIIGKNNLVISPEYGAHVRFRAMSLDKYVEPTKPTDFNPCAACDMPCIQACPQKAFKNGSYNRMLCDKQMKIDEKNRIILESSENDYLPGFCIKYCRACELACPVANL